MDEGLRAEIVERAGRNQAARLSLRPDNEMAEWNAIVAPVDLQQECLPLLEDAVTRGDASPADVRVTRQPAAKPGRCA